MNTAHARYRHGRGEIGPACATAAPDEWIIDRELFLFVEGRLDGMRSC